MYFLSIIIPSIQKYINNQLKPYRNKNQPYCGGEYITHSTYSITVFSLLIFILYTTQSESTANPLYCFTQWVTHSKSSYNTVQKYLQSLVDLPHSFKPFLPVILYTLPSLYTQHNLKAFCFPQYFKFYLRKIPRNFFS